MVHHHTISGLVGKLVTELEHHEDIPDAITHIYTSVKVVEGHGITSGCVKEWGYLHEGKELVVKETTTYTEETRTIHHSVVGGDLSNDYKKFDATLVVNPNPSGHGSIVSWTIDYEKINEDSPVPIPYLALFHQIIEDLNSHLCASD
ncbi:hypothetical protein MKX03_021374 [Papaver bracteatum]|nr:hypothetical protein MKX03_021374 [Papaver bracteatum]